MTKEDQKRQSTFNLKFDKPALATTANDNLGAYNYLQQMIKNGDRLTVTIQQDTGAIPYAWIESKKSKGFRYNLNKFGLNGLMRYMLYGEIHDFDPHPMDTPCLIPDRDLQWDLFVHMIEHKHNVQLTPQFREYGERITGVAPMPKGKLIFKLKRTEERLDIIREHNYPI